MLEAARTSETSDNIHLRTQQYIPEDSELQPFNRLVDLDKILYRGDDTEGDVNHSKMAKD
jgi:hypothetical protein